MWLFKRRKLQGQYKIPPEVAIRWMESMKRLYPPNAGLYKDIPIYSSQQLREMKQKESDNNE